MSFLCGTVGASKSSSERNGSDMTLPTYSEPLLSVVTDPTCTLSEMYHMVEETAHDAICGYQT